MKYWKHVNQQGEITSVESHSNTHIVPDAVEIDSNEYDAFINSLPKPTSPTPINYKTELDELKARVSALEVTKQ